MKRIQSVLLTFSLLFLLTACSKEEPSQESGGQTINPFSQQESISASEAVLEPESTESGQSANNTLIVYFSRWGNTEYPSNVDATSSASIVINGDLRYGTTEYVANMIAENVGGDLHRQSSAHLWRAMISPVKSLFLSALPVAAALVPAHPIWNSLQAVRHGFPADA